MILGLERLKEEVSVPQSLGTHSNLSEFTPSHLLVQVYVLHEAGKWKRHVKCRNGVPADLASLSILTSRSCIGLLANRLHTNDQLEVTEDSPWLDFKALCAKLKIFSCILKASNAKEHPARILTHLGKNSWSLSLQTKIPPKATPDKRGKWGMGSKPHAWNAELGRV